MTNDPTTDLSLVSTGPAVAGQGQVIEIITVITNNGPSGVPSFRVAIVPPPGTRSLGVSSTSGACYGHGACDMFILGAGQSATIRHSLEVTAVAGSTIHYSALASGVSAIDPNLANNTSTLAIPVVVPAAVPGLSPWGLGALIVILAVAGLWVQRLA